MYFMSHSWGGLVTTKFLMGSCGTPVQIRGQIMLDPIDGFLWNKPILEPGLQLNFSIPTIMVTHGNRATPADGYFQQISLPALATPSPSHMYSPRQPEIAGRSCFRLACRESAAVPFCNRLKLYLLHADRCRCPTNLNFPSISADCFND